MDESQKKARLLARRQASQRRRLHNVLLAGVFLLMILLFFLINLLTPTREFSDTENRNLSQKPSFTWAALADGSYFSGLTDYYNDQFFARDGWISLKLREDSFLGRKESGGVYLCQNDYLMAKPAAPDPEALTANLDAVAQFAGEHPDISMRMMLAPTAASILPDYLPKNAPVRDQLQDLTDVKSRLDGKVQFLDVAGPLKAHAQEEIYYKTDHHWTSLGAYYAFTANTGSLGIGTPVSDYDIYTVTNGFEGTLSSKSGSHSVTDSIQIYVPKVDDLGYYVTYSDGQDKICSIYRSDCLEVKDKYTVFFGGNHPLVEIQTTANNGRSLLVFKDSYANCFMQFLLPYYEKIVMVDPRYYYDSLDTILNSYGITDVLYLFCSDTFLTDSSLADVLTAGGTTGSLTDHVDVSPDSGTATSAPAEDSALEDSSPESSTQEPSSTDDAEGSASDTEDSAFDAEDSEDLSPE